MPMLVFVPEGTVGQDAVTFCFVFVGNKYLPRFADYNQWAVLALRHGFGKLSIKKSPTI